MIYYNRFILPDDDDDREDDEFLVWLSNFETFLRDQLERPMSQEDREMVLVSLLGNALHIGMRIVDAGEVISDDVADRVLESLVETTLKSARKLSDGDMN